MFPKYWPVCLSSLPTISPGIVRAVNAAKVSVASPSVMAASAHDAPGPEATKALMHATIQPAVTGAAAAGRELFVTATQSVAVN
jgi:hypothetical protein